LSNADKGAVGLIPALELASLTIHNKEMLAIIRCLDEWRHLLEGAQSKFEIWSNHKNLKYFMSSQKLNYKQAR